MKLLSGLRTAKNWARFNWQRVPRGAPVVVSVRSQRRRRALITTMSLVQNIKDDIREARAIRLPWWGVLSWMAICGLIEWLLVAFGRFDLGLPTLNSVAVVGFTIALKRKLGHHAWFWITMTVLAILHVPLVLFVPWTTKWVPAFAIAAIDSGDLIVMLVILAVVGKFMAEQKTIKQQTPSLRRYDGNG